MESKIDKNTTAINGYITDNTDGTFNQIGEAHLHKYPKTEKRPTMRGEITINNETYQISLWEN